jgi:putative colanic acid biosynthesis acetyltransferase WcaF
MTIDIEANRRARKWATSELVARVLWAIVYVLFRVSPRILWGWRSFLLRLFGARIGRHVHIHPSVRIAIPWNLDIGDFTSIGDRVLLYNLGMLSIGARATVSHGAHLCGGTHDYRDARFPLIKSPIHVGEGAWVCADAFVGPGVTVGSHAIVAARAVVMGDVAPRTIVAGNPAKPIGARTPPVDA